MIAVDDASTGVAQMAQGPSKYLVLASNNSEMRAGSGMLLSAGVMTMENGQFDLGPMTDTGNLIVPPGVVPLAANDFAKRWGWADPSQEWRNLAMSPNFPASAALAVQMWKAKTGEQVDGVFAIDPLGLQALIEVSGPVVVDGKQITKENVIHETLLQSYLDYEGDEGDEGDEQANTEARRERSSDIARAVIDQLDQQGWDVAKLVEDLQTAAQGRHIMAWSSNPQQQRRLGGGGDLGRAAPRLAARRAAEPWRQQAGPVRRRDRRPRAPRGRRGQRGHGTDQRAQRHAGGGTEHLRRGSLPADPASPPGSTTASCRSTCPGSPGT